MPKSTVSVRLWQNPHIFQVQYVMQVIIENSAQNSKHDIKLICVTKLQRKIIITIIVLCLFIDQL